MRKLKACVHIKAPVQAVQSLASSDRRSEWMVTRRGVLLHSLTESWEATEVDDGTRFTLHMEYRARLPFLEPLMSDSFHQAVTHSLCRLKKLAESSSIH